jgi:tape measure domain-containing protein
MADVKELIVELRLENKQLKRELKKTDKDFKELNKTTKKTEGGFSALKLLGVGFASVLGGVVVRGLTKFVKSAGKLEQVNIAFTTFLGSADLAAIKIRELQKLSAVTPFTQEQVLDAGKALLAFGIAADDLTPKLKQIGDLSAGTGKDFNELSVIFGKAKVQGTLFAEDINQLTEAGIPIIDEFAKILNVTPDQVKKLGSESKITFPLLEKAFKNLTSEGGRFFNLTEKQSKSFLGRISTLQSNLQILATNIGTRLISEIGPLTDNLNEIAQSQKTIVIAANSVALSLTLVKTLLTNLLVPFRAFGVIGQAAFIVIEGAIDKVTSKLEFLGKATDFISSGFKKVSSAVTGFFTDANSKVDETIKNLESDTLGKALNTLKTGFQNIGTDVSTNYVDLINNLKNLIVNANQEIVNSVDKTAASQRMQNNITTAQRIANLQKELDIFLGTKKREIQAGVDTKNNIVKASGDILQTEINRLEQIDEADTNSRNKQKKKIRDIAIANKAIQLASATVDSITAIVKTMASVPFPFNIPLIGAQTAAGAAQVGLIASQKIPEFQAGGVVSGLNAPIGNEDGIIAAQNGEAVLNRNATFNLGEETINKLNRGENLQPVVNITVNNSNGEEVVDKLNDYFRQFGGGRTLGVG